MGTKNKLASGFWFAVQNWGLAVTLISGGLSYWALLNQGLGPAGTAIFVFLSCLSVLWFCIGVTRLWDRFGAYNYALGYESVFSGGFPAGHNLALQIGVAFRNVGPGAIAYQVQELRVVIGTTTIAKPTYTNNGGLIPRGVLRRYSFPAFSQADIAPYVGTVVDGVIEFTVLYGPADSRLRRKLHMKLDVTYHLDTPAYQVADTISFEEDSVR